MSNMEDTPLLKAEDAKISPVDAPLWPQLLWGRFDEYDEEERAVGRHVRDTNVICLIVWSSAYLGVVSGCAQLNGSEAWPVTDTPKLALAAQIAFTFLALYTLYVDYFCMNMPRKQATEYYEVLQGPTGKWIFLTRQTIGVQAIHFVVTLLAWCRDWTTLLRGSYYVAPYIAGCGAFVTVQFFLLVAPHPDFQKDCRTWALRGIHYGLLARGLHVPQVILALADMLLLRNRGTLVKFMPSCSGLIVGYLLYVCFYLALIHANHAVTRHWPYGFLKDLGNSVMNWTKFLVAQTCILLFFGFSVRGLVTMTPGAW